MGGNCIASIARRLLHGQTFDLIVAPAIADLQFEAAGPTPPGPLVGYVAVWMAFCGALCRDLQADLHELVDDAPALARVIAIQAAYYTTLLALLNALPRPYLVTIFGCIALVALVQTLVCFWPPRRSGVLLPD
jgi:uncharacterized membrane protein YraQ (UPF0718 family)